jgi:chemotaxis protein MotB
MMSACTQVGCVSQEKYDELHIAWEKQKEGRLQAEKDLAICRGLRDSQAGEISTLKLALKDRQGNLDAMLAKVAEASQVNADLRADRDRLRKLLEEKEAPVVVIKGPRLPKAVDEALKKFAATHPGLIQYDEKLGLVRFSSDVLFALGSVDVKPEIARQLGDLAEVINIPEAQVYDVLIVGHTDTVPIKRAATKARTPTNWHLSCYRACSVLLVLQSKGVDAKRMGALGFGEMRPRVPDKGRSGTPENRRVEVFLVPKGSMTTTGLAPGIIPGPDVMAAVE